MSSFLDLCCRRLLIQKIQTDKAAIAVSAKNGREDCDFAFALMNNTASAHESLAVSTLPFPSFYFTVIFRLKIV